MLVVLRNKDIVAKWDLFKEILRDSIPITPDLKPQWITECLFYALIGHLQFWLCYDHRDHSGHDSFYCGFVTMKKQDDLTGQCCMLIYAIKTFKKVSHETRYEDMQALARVCKAAGIERITAFTLSKTVVNALKKVFPHLEMMYYWSLDVNTIQDFQEVYDEDAMLHILMSEKEGVWQ